MYDIMYTYQSIEMKCKNFVAKVTVINQNPQNLANWNDLKVGHRQ